MGLLLMRCADCASWITATKVVYDGDGSVIEIDRAPAGKGRCTCLGIDTAPGFACQSFSAGDVHEILTHKPGAPWEHSHAGPCPDCRGAGSAHDTACRRCAGTGKVRHYDDGYIGEEQTRLHPMELAAVRPRAPACTGCGAALDRAWANCPHCGARTEKPEQTRVIADDLRTA
jgi:hypothetical protein